MKKWKTILKLERTPTLEVILIPLNSLGWGFGFFNMTGKILWVPKNQFELCSLGPETYGISAV